MIENAREHGKTCSSRTPILIPRNIYEPGCAVTVVFSQFAVGGASAPVIIRGSRDMHHILLSHRSQIAGAKFLWGLHLPSGDSSGLMATVRADRRGLGTNG